MTAPRSHCPRPDRWSLGREPAGRLEGAAVRGGRPRRALAARAALLPHSRTALTGAVRLLIREIIINNCGKTLLRLEEIFLKD